MIPFPSNASVFETEISTAPVSIHVKPMPVQEINRILQWRTGLFTIQSKIIKHPDSKNSEGIIQVSITGKGNFIQLDAPMIKWPPGLDGLEPAMNDSLDKTITPLMGTRIFHYPFIANKTGDFTLDPVSFSFFNPDTGDYKTVSTDPLHFTRQKTNNRRSGFTPWSSAFIKLQKPNGSLVLIGLGLLLFTQSSSIFSNRRKRMKT